MNEPAPERWRRVLCTCLSGIGDALTATPFLRELKKARPELRIDVLTMFEAARELFERNEDVSEVFHIDFLGQSSFASFRETLRLRRNRYDAVVATLPANRAEYNLIQVLTGGRRLGHRYVHGDRANLNFLRRSAVREDESLHVVENNLALLPLFGVAVPSEAPALRFPLAPEDERFAEEWMGATCAAGRRAIGFHAGTARFKNHVNRRWEPEKFAELARRLTDEEGAEVLIFGGPDETELKRRIRSLAGRDAAVRCVDGVTLRQSAALIARCSLFVSNDSALMHVASAMSTPVVAVFAYTNPTFVHPWKVPHRIVRKALPCSPCFYYSPKPARCAAGRDFECRRAVGVDEVFAACRSLSAETSGSPATPSEGGGVSP